MWACAAARPPRIRARTEVEKAQLGLNLHAWPGGENGSQDPRRSPPLLRPRTDGEEAQVGLSLRAGPGGDNSSQDPRRFPPSFHGGKWSCCLINPTSVCAHLADIKTLPAVFLFLPEVSLTAGAQRYATKELAGGERGLNTVWGAPHPARKSTKGAFSQWDSLPGGVGAPSRKPAGIQRIALPIPKN